jgi:hypothetical protein
MLDIMTPDDALETMWEGSEVSNISEESRIIEAEPIDRDDSHYFTVVTLLVSPYAIGSSKLMDNLKCRWKTLCFEFHAITSNKNQKFSATCSSCPLLRTPPRMDAATNSPCGSTGY